MWKKNQQQQANEHRGIMAADFFSLVMIDRYVYRENVLYNHVWTGEVSEEMPLEIHIEQ